MKPACLNGFDVETNLSNQSFTALDLAKVRNGLFEERYEMLGRNAHYAENISQLFG